MKHFHIKQKLYVERQGIQKQHCSRRSRGCMCEQQLRARHNRSAMQTHSKGRCKMCVAGVSQTASELASLLRGESPDKSWVSVVESGGGICKMYFFHLKLLIFGTKSAPDWPSMHQLFWFFKLIYCGWKKVISTLFHHLQQTPSDTDWDDHFWTERQSGWINTQWSHEEGDPRSKHAASALPRNVAVMCLHYVVGYKKSFFAFLSVFVAAAALESLLFINLCVVCFGDDFFLPAVFSFILPNIAFCIFLFIKLFLSVWLCLRWWSG